MNATPMSKPGADTTVEREGWFYNNTYLEGEYGDAYRDPGLRSSKCCLLVKRVQLRRGPSGSVRRFMENGAVEFPSRQALLRWVRRHDVQALPSEADGNPMFMPKWSDQGSSVGAETSDG